MALRHGHKGNFISIKGLIKCYIAMTKNRFTFRTLGLTSLGGNLFKHNPHSFKDKSVTPFLNFFLV